MKTLLIVEDSEDIRAEFRGYFRDWQVIMAHNGAEGLAKAKSHHIDLILTDLEMPEMNGHSMLMEIKKIDHLKGIPAIVMTTHTDKRLNEELQKLNITGKILKPFLVDQVEQIANQIYLQHISSPEEEAVNSQIIYFGTNTDEFKQLKQSAVFNQHNLLQTQEVSQLKTLACSDHTTALIIAPVNRSNIEMIQANLRLLRSWHKCSDIPIILITDQNIVKKTSKICQPLKISGLVTRPLNIREFVSSISIFTPVSKLEHKKTRKAEVSDPDFDLISESLILDFKQEKILRDNYKKLKQILDEKTNHFMNEIIVRKRTEAELEEKNRALIASQQELIDQQKVMVQKAKLALMGEMSAGIIHEINNPLFILQGNLGQIRKILTTKNPKALELIEDRYKNIEESLSKVKKIISHMKKFSRVSSDSLQTISLNEVVSSSSDFMLDQLRSDHISLQTTLCSGSTLFLGDEIKLEQVIVNLINNAKDAILDSPQKSEGLIEIKTKCENQELILTIKDNGSGMTEETKSRIFDAFYTTKATGKGTGLGMSVSWGIVKEFGGSISVDSKHGYGSEFKIKFPNKESNKLAS